MPVPLDLAIALGLLGAVVSAPLWMAFGAWLIRPRRVPDAVLKPPRQEPWPVIGRWTPGHGGK